MRGVPRHPIDCLKCGQKKAALKDQLCHSCRIKSRPNSNRRFIWDDRLDSRLRAAYSSSASRQELTRNLNAFQYSTGFTRVVIISRAVRLGLSSSKGQPWSNADVAFLDANVGTLSISLIARKLSRSYYSVKAQIARRALSGRVLEGYTKQDLAHVLGVGSKRIDAWFQRGFLVHKNGRVPENSVVRFLKAHPEEYRLGSVDEAWFKGLLFPSFGQLVWKKTDARSVHATF